MSRENVEIVRKPLRVPGWSSRAVDERFALRFPRLFTAYVACVLRLSPASRLRQMLVWRGGRLVVAAYNRRDLAVLLLYYHPEVEYHPAPEWVEAGLFEPTYRGHEGFRSVLLEWDSVWPGFRQEPLELIDLGDRFVLLGRIPAPLEGSALPLTQEYALVITWSGGKVTRHDDYFDHAQALAAVGLSEPAPQEGGQS